MEPTQPQPPLPRRVRLVQWLRWLLKATVWHGLTALLDRAGFTPQTVQVLCIDPQADKLLLLRTREYRCGLSPVQGLRRGTLTFGLVPGRLDVREDARRELAEEAIPEPPPLADFRVAERYREGPYQQFDCTVLVVFCEHQAVILGPETAEGQPCWLPVGEAVERLGNRTLRDLFADWRDDPGCAPDAPAQAQRRRFILGPALEVQGPAAQGSVSRRGAVPADAEPALPRLWPMSLSMLAAARRLGRRDAAQVYQANPKFAAELWNGMSTAARDCYRPDPRLWRDCRLLDAARPDALLAGWREARVERLAARNNDSDACSIPGCATPEAALALQRLSRCEMSLDLIYDSVEDRVGCFLTRGAVSGVISDVLLYAHLSARYVPIPVFHTHPIYRTALGYKQPSAADFWVMGALYYRLEGASVGDCAFFPDGTWTEYGITGHGRCCFRRAGDPLLPAAGEPVTTFIEVALPERTAPSVPATP
ncbi:hypothetical protein [uncultured Thiohalocapsa sp.]|uniref:hypothetical protein n=1 Tax=uncultured Thiohalocapsa sp. TaxID=768990 RepID=UPI0025E4DC3B|nr:hypothetical protein [uncultured Thiohalocapsa sp.]